MATEVGGHDDHGRADRGEAQARQTAHAADVEPAQPHRQAQDRDDDEHDGRRRAPAFVGLELALGNAAGDGDVVGHVAEHEGDDGGKARQRHQQGAHVGTAGNGRGHPGRDGAYGVEQERQQHENNGKMHEHRVDIGQRHGEFGPSGPVFGQGEGVTIAAGFKRWHACRDRELRGPYKIART